MVDKEKSREEVPLDSHVLDSSILERSVLSFLGVNHQAITCKCSFTSCLTDATWLPKMI